MGGGGYGRHHGQSSTSDVFILDRVAQKTQHEQPEETNEVSGKQRRGVFRKGGSRHGGSKQLNLNKPRITKALSVDDGQLRLTKPLDVSIKELPSFYIINRPNLSIHRSAFLQKSYFS